MTTKYRKTDHIKICLKEDVSAGSTGLESFSLEHRTLPEIDLDDIDLSLKFLSKKLDYPIVIEGMTGGTEEGKKINRELAELASEYNIGLGVGSQRAAIEDPSVTDTFQVRDIAPDILFFGNLGAVQLNYGFGLEECRAAVDMIGADALALHINPLQEAVQPEGDTNFSGLEKKINHVAGKLKVPVIAKGVGSGLSFESAKKLNKVTCFDVGGVGGTSWPLVESFRGDENHRHLGKLYGGLGIPTAENIVQLVKLKKPLIASGGIRTGKEAAKAVALGADVVGMALPFLKALKKDGKDGVRGLLDEFVSELRIAMFLSGSKNLKELKGKAR
ncbi:MAG: type 2 isopentenyl-diphosphate Delta-isomerase [Candidatus Altiarchaeota archaeon]